MADLATELIAMGEKEFSERYAHPAFVRRDIDEEADDSEFYTGVMSRPTLGMLEKDLELATQPRLSKTVRMASQVFPVRKGKGAFRNQIGIGRTRNADVTISLPLVSKYHAEAVLQEDESLLLSDAGSKNGTYAHDQRLGLSEQVKVKDMEEVCFGPYRFLYMNTASFLDSVKFWASFRQ